MPRRPARRAAVLVAAAALVTGLAGCGSDDPAAEAAADPGTSGGAFPVSIENEFGTTEIPAEPKRVVTIGFTDQDYVLALGVTPVGVREYIGGYDAQQRPWAADQLAGAELPTVGGAELDIEAIAALEPDLIVAVYSYLSEQSEYDQLAAIAPVVAQTDEYADGATPWQEATELIGTALGREEQAEELVEDVEDQFEQATAEHPEFAGTPLALDLTGVGSGHFLLGADDPRSQFFTDLGFTVPDTSTDVSQERLDLLDSDVYVAIGYSAQDAAADALLSARDVVTTDRAVYLGSYTGDISAALGFGSPLSLPYLLDAVVPALDAAADGDPATKVEQPTA